MGKYKSRLEEIEALEHYHYIDVDEIALFEYQQMCHEEELVRSGKKSYHMNPEEEASYNLYMEGKLCGEHKNTAHTNTGMNLKDGLLETGENAIPKYRKRKSVE